MDPVTWVVIGMIVLFASAGAFYAYWREEVAERTDRPEDQEK